MSNLRELSDVERLLDKIKRIKIYPDEKPPPEEHKPDIFENEFIMKKLGNGNIQKGKQRMKQLLQRKLYWAYELPRTEYEALMQDGYTESNTRSKNKRLVVRNEKGIFEYVICLLPDNESMQHMRDKEFIANLNRDIAQVEWQAPDSMNRIDVAFDTLIGVEVQNCSLEYSRLKEKVDLLEKVFDYWFVIVPKKFVKSYDYLETRKGDITTMNEAVQKITEILQKCVKKTKKAK